MRPVHFMRGPRGQILEPLCGVAEGTERTVAREDVDCWRCVHLLLGRPLPVEPAASEHERLAKAKKTNDATTLVGDFFTWLTGEKGYVLGRFARSSSSLLMPVHEPVTRLLAEFFGISEGALESERQALLDHNRAVSAAQEWAAGEGRRTLGAGRRTLGAGRRTLGAGRRTLGAG